MRMIKPGHRRPYWLGPLAIFSGCRPCRCSPVRVTLASVMLACQSAPRRARRRAFVRVPNQSAASRTPVDESTFAGPILARLRRHERVVIPNYATGVVLNRTPLLRFSFPFSVHWSRRAVPGCRALRTIPLRRFLPCRRPARPRNSPAKRRPCGFTLLGCEAVVLDVRTNYRLRLSESQGVPFVGVPNNPHARRQVNGHSRKRVRRIRISRARERPVTSSNTASPIRRQNRVMHRRVPWRGVPLPRLQPSRPGRTKGSFPHAFARRRSWGSCSARCSNHWSADDAKASFSSPCADVPALGLSLANWL
jgi:hypothetical protein